jgi:LuxR family maltose regulon positive regulatory protein
MAPVEQVISPASFATFGELLRYLRMRAQLSRAELARAAGYSESMIARLELNQRRPDPITIQARFVPALELETETAWVERLLALAQTQPSASAQVPAADPPPASQPGDAAPPQASPVFNVSDILATKLFLPRPRPHRVARPQLLARLDAALDVTLTLICAPAGWGKSSLLAAWLADGSWQAAASSPVPRVGWLALDEGDNDPSIFLRYLVAACQVMSSTAGEAALAMLRQPQPPGPETVLRALLNDMAMLPQVSVLVLDDYHLLTTPAVHASMRWLLEHLPPTLHLILATRADPPLPLHQLRARGQLLELRADELRFSETEAAHFLTQVMGLPLAAADVAELERRTEGWIAGLQLAALALKGRSDPAGFIGGFTRANRLVLEYLAEEVFARQPAHLQEFLLRTAILDRMCGPLCDAVLGLTTDHRPPTNGGDDPSFVVRRSSFVDSYSQLILDQIEHANLFVVPLDDEGRWYRYHHLFGAMLRERLHRGATAAEVAQLHQRSAAWFETQGLVVEAVRHAIAGGDWERAARIIEAEGIALLVRGQFQTVLGWMQQLPEAALQTRPLLSHAYAIALMATNQFAAARARLDTATRHFPPDLPHDLAQLARGRLVGLRAHIAFVVGDFDQAAPLFEQSRQFLMQLPADTPIGRMAAITRSALDVYGSAIDYKASGDISAAMEGRLEAGIAAARASGNQSAVLNGYTYLASLRMLGGRLRAVAATYHEVERLVPGNGAQHVLFGGASYYVGLGEIAFEQNNLILVDRLLTSAMAFLEGTMTVDADLILRGFCTQARLEHARGNSTSARATLDAFVRLAHERQLFPLLIAQAEALRARFDLIEGNLAAATAWADGSGVSLDDEPSFPRESISLTLARVRIATGQAEMVLPLLARLLADAEAKARMHSVIEISVLRALGYNALADHQRAQQTLSRALTLAAPEGYVRVFLGEGPPMGALLAALPTATVQREAIGQLLASIGDQWRTVGASSAKE